MKSESSMRAAHATGLGLSRIPGIRMKCEWFHTQTRLLDARTSSRMSRPLVVGRHGSHHLPSHNDFFSIFGRFPRLLQLQFPVLENQDFEIPSRFPAFLGGPIDEWQLVFIYNFRFDGKFKSRVMNVILSRYRLNIFIKISSQMLSFHQYFLLRAPSVLCQEQRVVDSKCNCNHNNNNHNNHNNNNHNNNNVLVHLEFTDSLVEVEWVHVERIWICFINCLFSATFIFYFLISIFYDLKNYN